MCGITGKVFFERNHVIEPSELKRMTDSIYHRGPDDEGFLIDGNVGLGFRRLSIIDLSTGHQPLSNEDESVTLVFNGEIYNYLEQKELLRKKGYTFRTATDTEVILHLYEEYGVDCLQYLRGMFAFAIWDKRKQQLFCARDRFGIKPFYYYLDGQKLVFGSEIKTIMASGNIDKTISFEGLDSYLSYGYITSDLSIYKNIHKLRPAHYLLLSLKDKAVVETKQYWEIKFQPDFSRSVSDWMEEIESCLSETVRMHMISDVPLGAFLSGGIDSSSVVAMMARNSNLPIKTFSIGFKEEKYNELEYAREIATKYNCEHHEQIIEPESITLLPKLVAAYDEPYADSSAIPTYYVSKLAREFVTVALSGDGGDELFAGYNIYNYFQRLNSHPLNFKSENLNKLIWGTLHKIIPHNIKGSSASYFLSQNKSSAAAYLTFLSRKERKSLLLNKDYKIDYSKASENYKESILKKGQGNDFISNLQYLDLQTYMVDDILTKVDRASMLNSLEVRVPLLDHVFAELSFRIPWNLKLKGMEQKYILKESMAPHLTKNVLNHPKQGFGVPLSVWFKDDLSQYVKDTLLSDNPKIAAYLDKNEVRRIVEHSYFGNRDLSNRVWQLLCLEEWIRQNS
ncbi:MAG: asparagine synthase (glutamine-hydrolyzing) [Bacteroidales bacterium]|nr:asparagine synthase (glutamine-hydrolyzing) [Bacteroidales bacterium]